MGRKKIFFASIVAIITATMIVGVTLFALNQKASAPGDITSPEQVTLDGTFVCLPHKNTGPGQPHTLECAFGLYADDGHYYGLQNLAPPATQTPVNTEVTVSGTLTPPPDDSIYDIRGTIEATSFATR